MSNNKQMAINHKHAYGPMYFQIKQIILEQIHSGKLQPGGQLPTETELSEQYHVSRITSKRALDDLVRQGLAFRLQGKGTFVAQPRIREISGFRSFSEDIRAKGFNPSSKVSDFEEVEPEAAVCDRLHLADGEHAIRLKRLRLANLEPVAVETAYLPCSMCPGLIDEDLNNGSLYNILTEKFQVVPCWGDAEIEATAATKEEALLLNIKAGTPVLVAHRVTFAADFAVIEAVDSVYRGDRFTFYTGRHFMG